MKKYLKIVLFAATAALSAYTVIAILLIHGLGVYRLSTSVGTALSNSYQYTLLAALVLWGITAILLFRWYAAKHKQEKEAMKIAPANPNVGVAIGDAEQFSQQDKHGQGKKKTAKGEEPKIAAARPMFQPESVIQPAGPVVVSGAEDPQTQPMPSPDVPAPAPGTQPMPLSGTSEALSAPALDTQPMPQPPMDTKPMPAFQSPDIPAYQPFKVPQSGQHLPTMPMPQAEPEQSPKTAGRETVPMPAQMICPSCGTVLKSGAKFCVKCGKRQGESL